MYLRETRRTNKDGSVARYLQLAHNERHPETGASTAKVIHNFGRAEKVDRAALARLVSSISRFLDPAEAVAASAGSGGEIDVLDARRLGATWTLDRVWERLGVGTALRTVAASRRLDGDAVERVVFALVAQRLCEPGSKLAATRWVAERVAIEGCPAFSDDAAYASMDFLLAALEEIAEAVFASTAHLLNLSCDIIFVDTSSTYFEVEVADELAQVSAADDAEERQSAGAAATDEAGGPEQAGTRRFGHSKDHRPDLPQVVIGMAVTAEGVPVRCWTFPGNTSDQLIIRTVKDDLGAWNLNRVVWVGDRGFNSVANRAYLQRGGGHYILAEKLRHASAEARAALSRAGRYHTVAGNLRVKEVHVGDGARGQRFVVCHNPEEAERDQAVRANLLSYLREKIDDSDGLMSEKRAELVGWLRTRPGLWRFVRRTKAGLLRVDAGAISRDAHLDGKYLLRTSDDTLSSTDLAQAYRQLTEVERGWRDMKGALALRPVFHFREDRIRAHIQLCWLALLLMRVVENAVGDTWRNVRHELDRMALVTLATAEGRVAQRSVTTDGQRHILRALDLPEPPRFLDFSLTTTD